ncbi:hypothetical protein BFW01_g11260 [Lasiodiplodia theobromae]|uniref:Conidiation-specific protein 10 n=2 Tax=Lasiodiplodia TaxID=66739 RepID=A0A5N5D555_9PEZI|nr:Conidiation-specific protein con [Lasiodiplodia theobromae]KAB2572859.1 Conidiation-specific protein 10 [Lasiodiplodia theobromae]KAF4537577.1 Conidiation-specific protein con [Lasiodiplodia theobromae]KAF9639454.1 hypothetical protein BFW01_g11260 [Lasiodiplodia theobromae]KAK0612741.1 Conidiation-specific protein 10 [Lasiodiplodia hormozganensis]
MADTNPGNFANRPTEEVREIASKGGHAAQGHTGSAFTQERNPDGTFAGNKEEESHPPGRNPDGTFVKGSEAAKEAGHKGGIH